MKLQRMIKVGVLEGCRPRLITAPPLPVSAPATLMNFTVSQKLRFLTVVCTMAFASQLLGRVMQSSSSTTTAEALSTTATPAKRILCYGDSLTAGTVPPDLATYPYAPHLESALKDRCHNVLVRHRGLPGWSSSEMVKNVNDGTIGLRTAVRAGMPLTLVIILAGTNDLAYNSDAASITESVVALHKVCFDEQVPHTLAVGIPSSGYQSMNQEAADLAQAVNDGLQAYCQSEPRATFAPFPFPFSRNDEKWASDGLHFSAEGYRVLGTSLAPVVEQILITE